VPGANGTFLIAELGGEAGARIRALQERFDPKLARETPPHVTLAGSSGLGVVPPDVPRARVLELLAPVGAEVGPLSLAFGAPERFPGTNIVVLPLDPHGPIRALHDRIGRTGLPFARAKFTFTPHATLSFYPTLSAAALRELLALRVREPAVIDRLVVSHTRAPQPPARWGEVPLVGGAAAEPPGAKVPNAPSGRSR
jgi:2'-5' RNA ligase